MANYQWAHWPGAFDHSGTKIVPQQTRPGRGKMSAFTRRRMRHWRSERLRLQSHLHSVPVKAHPMGASKPPLPTNIPEAPGERLDSWKEIAAYLKRDERTVRRWEKEGLPVHRKVHKKQASVFAYREEIDGWWNEGRQRLEQKEQASSRKPITWWLLAGLATAGLTAFAVLGAGKVLERVRGAAAVPANQSLAVLP